MEFVIALTVLVVFGVLVIRNAVVTSREQRRDERRSNRAATTGELIRDASLELLPERQSSGLRLRAGQSWYTLNSRDGRREALSDPRRR